MDASAIKADSRPATSQPRVISLNRICLDVQLRQDRYRDQLNQFLKTHRREMDLEGEDLVQVYLDRVWPDDLPGAMIVANISRQPHPLWLFRPPVSGPQAKSFAAGGFAPAFRAYRRQGALVIVGVDIVPHVQPRPFEALVTGRVSTRQSETMSTKDMSALESIPRNRQEAENGLQVWCSFLDWRERLIHRGQTVLSYDRFERSSDGSLHFQVRLQQDGRQLDRMEGMVVLAAPAGASQDRYTWAPLPGKKPVLSRVGIVERIQIEDKARSHSRPGGHAQGKDQPQHRRLRAEVFITPDDEAGTEDASLPGSGFLLFNIGGEIRPLKQERAAIDRLCKGYGHSPYLLDWLSRGENAGQPDYVEDITSKLPSTEHLNPQQLEAIRKAMSAPDCCLIQGPPGTGKTSLIAWLCYLMAAAGQRVLVASQTNLAVDNVLSRLPDLPEIRPLRIGKEQRIDETVRELLQEKATARWLGKVLRNCRANIDRSQARRDSIRGAERGFAILQGVLDETVQLQHRLTELEGGRETISRKHHEVVEVRDAVRRLQQEIIRDCSATNEIVAWLDQPNAQVPTVPAQAVSVSEAIEQVWQGLRDCVTLLRWPLPGIQSGNNLFSIYLARLAVSAAGELQTVLMEALALCRGAAGTADENSGLKLRELLAQRAQLLQSEREEDLVAVAGINRQINALRQGCWSSLCRTMLQPLNAIFDGQIPSDLDEVMSSLQPDLQHVSVLSDLQEFSGYIRDGLGASLTDYITRLKEVAATAGQAALDRQTELRVKEDSVQQEIDLLEAQIAEVDDQLEQVRLGSSRCSARWAEVWPDVCADLAAPVPPAQISSEALSTRRKAYDVWRQQQEPELERHAHWHSVVKGWVSRLAGAAEAERQPVHSRYLRHANVVGMTCYEAGKYQFYADPEFRPFDVVIVDEASKLTLPEFLEAALLGRRLICVGDHRQLWPMFRENETTYEEAAEEGLITREDFDRHRKLVRSSFFETLFRALPATLKHTLRIQYRMHPQIMQVVNLFYNGQLLAGWGSEELDKRRQHDLRIPDGRGGWLLEPHQHLLWIDSSRDSSGRFVRERQQGTSKSNPFEADLVMAMLFRLDQALRQQGYGPANRKSVGVITFYGAQLAEIRRRLEQLQSRQPDALSTMDLRTNTVDRFQGMERSIVLVSLVRSVPNMQGGEYVKEYRRINVAFSRAQDLLVIIGSEQTFRNAMVELPSEDGTPQQKPVYREIYEVVKQHGGRRYAKQLL